MTAGPSKTTGALLVLGAACAWGTWSLFLRPTELPGVVTAPIIFAGIFLTSVPLFRTDAKLGGWDRRAILLVLAFGALDAVNVGTFFSAMGVTSVAVAVLTHCLAPVLVALAAPLVDRVVVPRAVPAALIAVVGLALVLEPWRPEARTGEVVLGAALGTTSAVAYAGNVFLVRRLGERVGAARAMGVHALISALLLAPLAAPHAAEIEGSDLLWLAGAIVVPGTLAGVAFVRGLNVIGAARTAVIALAEPVVACVIGFAVFDERLGPLAIVGGAMVLGAGAMVARAS